MSKYIRSDYQLPTCIIGAIFIAVGIVVGFKAFNVNTWSFGIIVLLFLALVLGIATLISLIATFKEMGRKQARGEADDMKKIKVLIDDDKLVAKLQELGFKKEN